MDRYPHVELASHLVTLLPHHDQSDVQRLIAVVGLEPFIQRLQDANYDFVISQNGSVLTTTIRDHEQGRHQLDGLLFYLRGKYYEDNNVQDSGA